MKNTKLWQALKAKAGSDSEKYIAGVESVCDFAIDRSKVIRDSFPMFTLHDKTHIDHVLALMEQLLGERIHDLSRDEAALLILAACCHDIGMSCSAKEKEVLLTGDRLKAYLDTHNSEYVKAYANGKDKPVITDEIFRNFLRTIHHERVADVLALYQDKFTIDEDLLENLIWICQSHGENSTYIEACELDDADTDLRMCAVLLRLADILDFTSKRAPETIYDYCGFDGAEKMEALVSKGEWDKNIASHGFNFSNIPDRKIPYDLPYKATCRSMQVEQAVNDYLNWVDWELMDCGRLLKKYVGEWQNLVLPLKVKRVIKSKGYLSGQYHFTLDQGEVIKLLGGEELYGDPAAFVRELLQNAIDAVRTRKVLDKSLPDGWTGQINIRTWTDDEGYDWFRIEDDGTGMSKEIILNHLLKVGSSYYNSDEFKKEKLLNDADPDYTPISRFGIGILSCFMGDEKHSRVEISTKRYPENKYLPALRLRMEGLNGYYAMYSSEKADHHPGEMPGTNKDEKKEYLEKPGTVVAVRTRLYRTGKYQGFKEIVDKWVLFPEVPIHYRGDDGARDYPTESEFMEAVHKFAPSDDLSKEGVIEFSLTESQLDKIRSKWPGIDLSNPPKVVFKCAALDHYTKTPDFSGVIAAVKVVGDISRFSFSLAGESIEAEVEARAEIDYDVITLKLSLKLSLELSRECDEIDYKLSSLYPREYLYSQDFDRAIEASRQAIEKETGLSGKKLELWKTQHDRSIWFSLYDLKKEAWYGEHLFPVRGDDVIYGVAGHNGIFCGEPVFLCGFGDEKRDDYGVLLLRDGYRPEMNLARDKIQRMPLEALFACEHVRARLRKEGYEWWIDEAGEKILSAYTYHSMKDFLLILENHSDWIDGMAVFTSEGDFQLRQIEAILREKHILTLHRKSLPAFSEYISSIYGHFLMAYLQAHCCLYLNDRGTEILLSEGQPNCGGNAWKAFPPGFFIPEKDENQGYLTSEGSFNRCGCNANHRLSRFLLDNGTKIQKLSPGGFNRIISIIAGKNDDVMISMVNDQLKIFQRIKGNPLGVTDDLFLKDEDLAR